MKIRVDDLTDETPELQESIQLIALRTKEQRRKGKRYIVAAGLDAAHIKELATIADQRLNSLGLNGYERQGVRFIYGTSVAITTRHYACKCVDIELERSEDCWYLTSISQTERESFRAGPHQLLLTPEQYKKVIDRFAKGAGIQVA